MPTTATIKTTEAILAQELCIPPYQRSYRWTTGNVLQLLEDIRESMEAGKREYRIGTLLFYRPNEAAPLEIVDGQQRLTTILLILKNATKGLDFKAAKRIRYQNNSAAAIRKNNDFIEKWMKENTSDNGVAFAQYLLTSCKFAEIVVNDLSEAFQMFDTQNGRGKSLELYNLLKAYHIRAMEQNTQEERVQCDRNWEDATQYDATPDIQDDPNVDILGQLFKEQLFKSRLWCRNETAKDFTKDDLDEFKGFTIDKNHAIDHPFQNPFLLQYLTEKFYRNVLAGTIGTQSRFEAGETEKVNPFVNLNQVIINGKAFFEYVETYVELYKKMFIELGSYQLADFKKFFYTHCLCPVDKPEEQHADAALKRTDAFRDLNNFSWRTGDTYLREVYKSLCFVLLDKFGEKILLKYYKNLFRLVYQIRIQHYAVRYTTAMELPKSLFFLIHCAKNTVDLLEIDKLASGLKNQIYGYENKLPLCISNFIKEGE